MPRPRAAFASSVVCLQRRVACTGIRFPELLRRQICPTLRLRSLAFAEQRALVPSARALRAGSRCSRLLWRPRLSRPLTPAAASGKVSIIRVVRDLEVAKKRPLDGPLAPEASRLPRCGPWPLPKAGSAPNRGRFSTDLEVSSCLLRGPELTLTAGCASVMWLLA